MAREAHLYYRPTQEGRDKIEQLRAKVIELDDLIDDLTDGPLMTAEEKRAAGRSAAIAKTKLQECRMRAIEAIVQAHHEEPETPEPPPPPEPPKPRTGGTGY